MIIKINKSHKYIFGKFTWYGLFHWIGFYICFRYMLNIFENKIKYSTFYSLWFIILFLGKCVVYTPELGVFKCLTNSCGFGSVYPLIFTPHLIKLFYTLNAIDHTIVSYNDFINHFVISLPLGQIFIRLGNLLNSEIIGRKINKNNCLLGIQYYNQIGTRYPVQIWESLGGTFQLLLFFALPVNYRFYSIYVIYWFQRIYIEFWKDGEANNTTFYFGIINHEQLMVSIALVSAISVGVIW